MSLYKKALKCAIEQIQKSNNKHRLTVTYQEWEFAFGLKAEKPNSQFMNVCRAQKHKILLKKK